MGKNKAWMGRRKEKGFFNNIVQELMIEDTGAYKDVMRVRGPSIVGRTVQTDRTSMR